MKASRAPQQASKVASCRLPSTSLHALQTNSQGSALHQGFEAGSGGSRIIQVLVCSYPEVKNSPPRRRSHSEAAFLLKAAHL